jgi:HlyD family secretion protein
MIERKKLASLVAAAAAPIIVVPIVVFMIAGTKSNGNPSSTGDMVLGTVRKGSFEVRVQLVGHLEAARSTTVCSEVKGDSGKIISLIENGKQVDKGDVLVRLDPTPFEEDVIECSSRLEACKANVAALQQALEWEKNQASREVNAAEYDLEVSGMELEKIEKGEGPLELAQLEKEMRRAQDDYAEKSSYLSDLEELERQGFSNPTEVAHAKRKISEAKEAYEIAERTLSAFKTYLLPVKIEMARAKVERARSDLEQTRKSMAIRIAKASAELGRAEQEMKAAETSLETANQQLSKTVIKAPIPGLAVIREVYIKGEKRKIQVGDAVWRNQPILYLPDISEMVVNAEVREVDLHKLRKDLPATVLVDAYPETRFQGAVHSIGVLAEKRTAVKSPEKYFQVVIALLEHDERLRPGMTAKVDILSGTATDALVVPLNALFEREGCTYCYVAVEDGYELREVSVGAQNEDFAEVREGLSEGENICLIEPQANRVRTRKTLEYNGSCNQQTGRTER